MQQGSVIREHRELGPDVWCFRWWESGPNGNRVHRRIVLGAAAKMRDASSVRQTAAGLVQAINPTDIRLAGILMTLAQLADHFHQRELGRSNGRISYSTKKAYQGTMKFEMQWSARTARPSDDGLKFSQFAGIVEACAICSRVRS